jgi:hypothetical protein
MFNENDDPFELHSRWFLKKLQRAISDFRQSAETSIGDHLGRFENLWPQVAAAFRWAVTQRESSEHASDLSNAFLACANSDDMLEFRRSPDELRLWSRSTDGVANRLSEDPDKADFVRQFAIAARLQSEQLTVVRATRSKLRALLSEIALFPKPLSE